MSHSEPFVFNTERRLVESCGIAARNLGELLRGLPEVPGSSVFYHTHCLYLEHHFEKPSCYNQFSLWVGDALREETLAEKLGAIDLLSFTSIRQLRQAIIDRVEDHLRGAERPLRECPPGDEFRFCKSKSFIMPTGIVACDVPDFIAKLHSVTNMSLYFHLFEAPLRLERPTNDFSFWLLGRGEEDMAIAIDRLDFYRMTLEELRSAIFDLCQRHHRG
ncbi:MAG: hypothetical protein FJW35_06425 [Acidobacteria bacterium]|nr:hypothetical protein [Acidobacteriota bacterium]